MQHYTITDLERLSGIKAHTLRVWEKRYDLFEPNRVGNNKRVYSDEDLRKVLCLSTLNKQGMKISKLAALSNKELNEKLAEVLEAQPQTQVYVDGLCSAMVDLDEPLFEKWLSRALIHMDFEEVVIDIFYPLLHRIGILWAAQNVRPAQEHFVSNLIRQKIISATDALVPIDNRVNPYILFLPETCWHEISLLFYQYLLKKWKVPLIYLGQHVNLEDLINIVKRYSSKRVVTSMIVLPEEPQMKELFEAVKKLKVEFLIGGNGSKPEWSELNKVHLFKSLPEFKSLILGENRLVQ